MLDALFPKQYLITGTDENALPIKQLYYAKGSLAGRRKAEIEGIKVQHILERPNPLLDSIQKGQLELGKPVSNRDLAIFSRQLARMISNNVQINLAFNILAESSKPRFRKIIQGVQARINDGESLAQAMASFPEVFDRTYVAIVQAAETAGQVPTALKEIANTLNRGDKVLRKVRTVSLYPAGVLVVALVAFVVFTNIVLPKMATLYEGSKTLLPLPTRIMLGISDAMRHNPLLPMTVLGVPIAIFVQRRRIMGNRTVQKFAIRLPIINKLIEKTCLVRILQLKAQFASNGVPVLRQYTLCEKAVGHFIYARAMREIRNEIAGGIPEALAWSHRKELPAMIHARLGAAETTGSTGDVLQELTNDYIEELDDAITTFTAVIEPIMIVFLVIFIGSMVAAMYAPVFSLGKALRDRQ